MSKDMMASIQGALPVNLSPWQMFLAADVVVQSVMVLLLLAGLATWVIWVVKLLELRASRREVAAALEVVQAPGSLSAMAKREDVLGVLSGVAVQEMQTAKSARDDGIQHRAAASLSRVEAALTRRINRGTGILATIGSTAPFIGLFGTVWGIMNSFIGIAQTQTTNLAVVAPGIAEALLATAMGLFAAIPAVIIYNALGRAGGEYCAQVADVITQVLNQLDRELQPQS